MPLSSEHEIMILNNIVVKGVLYSILGPDLLGLTVAV